MSPRMKITADIAQAVEDLAWALRAERALIRQHARLLGAGGSQTQRDRSEKRLLLAGATTTVARKALDEVLVGDE